MMKRSMTFVAAVAMALSAAGTPRIEALEPGQRLSVEIVGLSTPFDDGRYGATTQSSSAGSDLLEGETGRAYMAYGWVDDTAGFSLRNLCANGCGSIGSDDDPAAARERLFRLQEPAHYWSFAYKVLPAEFGKVDLEVTWEHWSQVGTGRPVKIGGDTRRVEMREGERSVIDSVSAGPSASDSCASVQVAITAHTVEDASVRNELLSYDVWFEHADASGGITRRHYESIGLQNQTASFLMAPMRFPIPEARSVAGASYDAVLDVSGSVRGRVKTDGSIQVRLKADRWTDVEEHGKPRRGGCGDGGEKVFTLAPGETVRMTLPIPNGSNAIDETLTRQGAVVGRNRVNVENSTFYKGSQDSIILTVDRVH